MTARPATTPTWGGTQIEPSGGQKAAGFAPGDRPPAQWFNWLLDNFADWVNYLDTEKLPSVTQASSSTPVFGSVSDSQDHPASPSNVYKLLMSGALADGTVARLYVGDQAGGAAWTLTVNAVWDPASGSQFWSKDDVSKISTQLTVNGNGLLWQGRAAVGGTWTTWSSLGTLTAQNIAALGTLAVTGAATVGGSLGVTGAFTSGAATVATLDATADVFAGDDVIATDEFQYSPQPTRTKAINPVQGGVTGINNGQYALFAAAEATNYPLHVPHGAALGNVRVQISNTGGTADYEIRIQRRQASAFGGSAPTFSDIDTEIGSDAAGITVLTLAYGGLVANKDESYQLHVLCPFGSVGSLIVYAIDYSFTDPGPRNH